MTTPEQIQFPCDYPIKVVTRSAEGLRARIDAIFAEHFGPFEAHRVTVRESAQANFIAYTYLMVVENVGQLSALHGSLRATDGVVMVL